MPAATAPRHSNRSSWWRIVGLAIVLPLVLLTILFLAGMVGDQNRIPGILALAAKESGVMYCSEGKIVHGDDSLLDRATEDGRFQCTSWKLRGEQTYTVKGAVTWPTSPRR